MRLVDRRRVGELKCIQLTEVKGRLGLPERRRKLGFGVVDPSHDAKIAVVDVPLAVLGMCITLSHGLYRCPKRSTN